jgi:hypothetical protein
MTSLNHDRVVDVFEAHGLRCVIALGGPLLRNYNGYVEAPAGANGSDESFDVHGGVTWSDWRLPWEEEDGERWWLGFDTSHAGDAVPGLSSIGIETTGIFRDVDYVRDECIKLASQLAPKGAQS